MYDFYSQEKHFSVPISHPPVILPFSLLRLKLDLLRRILLVGCSTNKSHNHSTTRFIDLNRSLAHGGGKVPSLVLVDMADCDGLEAPSDEYMLHAKTAVVSS